MNTNSSDIKLILEDESARRELFEEEPLTNARAEEVRLTPGGLGKFCGPKKQLRVNGFQSLSANLLNENQNVRYDLPNDCRIRSVHYGSADLQVGKIPVFIDGDLASYVIYRNSIIAFPDFENSCTREEDLLTLNVESHCEESQFYCLFRANRN